MKPKQDLGQANDVRPFCFKYCINLGKNNFGSLTVNEKTDLGQEAHKFCLHYGLDTAIAPILQNQMMEEVKKILRAEQRKSVGKIIKNKITQNAPLEKDKKKQPCRKSISQSNSNKSLVDLKKSHLIYESMQSEPKQMCRCCNHFQIMFQRHKQIENKKQLIRKSSFEKIPFKPSINKLSEKIVARKRSVTSANNSFVLEGPMKQNSLFIVKNNCQNKNNDASCKSKQNNVKNKQNYYRMEQKHLNKSLKNNSLNKSIQKQRKFLMQKDGIKFTVTRLPNCKQKIKV